MDKFNKQVCSGLGMTIRKKKSYKTIQSEGLLKIAAPRQYGVNAQFLSSNF